MPRQGSMVRRSGLPLRELHRVWTDIGDPAPRPASQPGLSSRYGWASLGSHQRPQLVEVGTQSPFAPGTGQALAAPGVIRVDNEKACCAGLFSWAVLGSNQ